MKFRFFSDLHLEKDLIDIKNPSIDHVWTPVEQPYDEETVLILAGDIWNGTRPIMFANKSWMARLSKRFKAVVVVFGNHDYWDDNVDTLSAIWRKMLADLSLTNVHVLELADGIEHGTVVIDDVVILGSTMWTDMDRGNPMVQSKFNFEKGFDGKSLWNDQNFIRTGKYHRFTSSHWLRLHREARSNFRAALDGFALLPDMASLPVLSIFHHAPCMISTQKRENDPLSCFLYGSDLSNLILDYPNIKQVIHGHTHDAFDYMMGDARIRCNPRGYAPGSLVKEFDPIALNELVAKPNAKNDFKV